MWKETLLEVLTSLNPNLAILQQVFEEKNLGLPKSLFRYQTINPNTLKGLDNGTVWLSDPSDLNDPFDSAFGLDPDQHRDYVHRTVGDQLTSFGSERGLIDRVDASAIVSKPDGLRRFMEAILEEENRLSADQIDKFVGVLINVFEKQSTRLVESSMAVMRYIREVWK